MTTKKGANTGPIKAKRKRPLPKGNPTKRGNVFGNWQGKSKLK